VPYLFYRLPGALGLAFRAVGGFIIVIRLYCISSKISFKAEAIMCVRLLVLIEAAYGYPCSVSYAGLGALAYPIFV